MTRPQGADLGSIDTPPLPITDDERDAVRRLVASQPDADDLLAALLGDDR